MLADLLEEDLVFGPRRCPCWVRVVRFPQETSRVAVPVLGRLGDEEVRLLDPLRSRAQRDHGQAEQRAGVPCGGVQPVHRWGELAPQQRLRPEPVERVRLLPGLDAVGERRARGPKSPSGRSQKSGGPCNFLRRASGPPGDSGAGLPAPLSLLKRRTAVTHPSLRVVSACDARHGCACPA